MKHLKTYPLIMTFFTMALFWSGTVSAQSTSSGRHMAGGFIGFTDRFETDFTFGGEYEYRMQGPWSVGAIVEHTPDVIFGEDFTLLMGTAHFRPVSLPRFKFTGGAGVEFKDVGGDDIRFRLGAGYDVYDGPFTVTPRVAVDFGEGDENVVLGVSLLRRF